MKITYRHLTHLLLLFILCIPTQLLALDISDHPEIESFINLSGEIKPKDADKLIAYYKNIGLPKSIFLNSNGGDLAEAMRIAEVVSMLQLQVIIPKGKDCLSACFFIYLGGSSRTASGTIDGKRMYDLMPAGYIGLHRPYLSKVVSSTKSQSAQTNVMKMTKIYLENQLVPNKLIDMMMSRPSNDIYWMTIDDIDDLGDYPPALEELFISKCDYDRRLANQLILAQKAGNNTLVSMLNQRLQKTMKCIAFTQAESFFEGISKIKSGWKPSINPVQQL